MRSDRKGFAAPAGFRDVKNWSALLAQAIDRHKKTLQRSSRLAGGSAVAVGRPALVRRLIGRDLIVLKPTDEEAQTPQQGGMLDFCPQKTELDVITPEASQGKSGQQLGRRHDMNELRSVLLAEDKLTC